MWPRSDYPKYRSPKKSVAILVFLVLISSVAWSCAKKSGDAGRVPRKTRAQLISQLMEKGAHTEMATRQTAYSAYRFAAFYAPQDKEIQAKYEEARKMTVGVDVPDPYILDFLKNWVRAENLRDFPASTPDTDLLNLEMLNDERLVGDLRYSVYSVPQRTLFLIFPPDDAGDKNGEEVCVFTSEPKFRYSLTEVRKIYGEPAAQGTNPDIMTYGRLRLIAEGERVRVVVFPLFPNK